MKRDQQIKILSVVGARPNFMKIAPIDRVITEHNYTGSRPFLEHLIVHTGQHYDDFMSSLFFEDLELPRPHINLDVGSASHAVQTAHIMGRFEPVLLREQPDVLLVVGDVNSTIACTLVASKAEYNEVKKRSRPIIGHVEAGLRSFDRNMPEEINRVLTDAIADLLFTTEESANENLECEGIPEEKIYFVGNVMIDTLLKHKKKAEQSNILYKLDLARHQPNNTKNSINSSNSINPYAILTLHRPANVDEKETFQNILEALSVIAKNLPIIFPIHPRTLKQIHEFSFEKYFDFSLRNPCPVGRDYRTGAHSEIRNKRIHCVDPLGYLDFLHLMANAKLVLTDSGGIQEETTVLKVPCVTLRKNTERPVTVTHGTNVIAGTDKENIISAAFSQLKKFTREGSQNNPQSAIRNPQLSTPPLWDGNASKRIVDVLIKNTDL